MAYRSGTINKFIIQFLASGIRVRADAETIIGAKREATKMLSRGCGDVVIFDRDDNLLARRMYWDNGNAYGWKRWN